MPKRIAIVNQMSTEELLLRYRLGLHPILRRVWIPEDEQPVASVIQKYKWMLVTTVTA
ncbi:MAG: hypothetical protein KME23_08230 [Goleter apudmare HA4340-LM2]|nr:hypothetical protein [Goleter apudmare HA4340-LM2]